MDCRWISPGRRKETDRKTKKKEKDWSDICVGKKKQSCDCDWTVCQPSSIMGGDGGGKSLGETEGCDGDEDDDEEEEEEEAKKSLLHVRV